MGPLSQGKRQTKFLLVVIDYFIKWVEAEALATITETKVQYFIWKNIVYRFGIPKSFQTTIFSSTVRHSGHFA